MKRKAHPWIISCLTFLLFLGFPSCDGPDYTAIRGIGNVQVYDHDTGMILNPADSTTSDSLAIFVYPEFESFAEVNYGTMASAWAFQPQDPWMANELVDIRVFCDKAIYGFQPGENLASHLIYGDYSFSFNLVDYLDHLPAKGEEAEFWFLPISILLPSKPVPDAYMFTVELEDNNGHIFSSPSPVFVWQ